MNSVPATLVIGFIVVFAFACIVTMVAGELAAFLEERKRQNTNYAKCMREARRMMKEARECRDEGIPYKGYVRVAKSFRDAAKATVRTTRNMVSTCK